MRVLVVAKERFVALALRDELETAGHVAIGPASSSGEALLLSNTTQPQYAIVDRHLECEEVGVHLAQRLRERHDIGILFTSDMLSSEQAHSTDALKSVPWMDDAQSIVRNLPSPISTGSLRR